MIIKNINSVVNKIVDPFMREAQKTHQATLERIHNAFLKAENEVLVKVESMTTDQRLKAAEQELDKAQAHMLAVVSSLYKSLLYLSPSPSFLVDRSVEGARLMVNSVDGFVRSGSSCQGKVEKEIKGKVVE